jgi:hypothetical protein
MARNKASMQDPNGDMFTDMLTSSLKDSDNYTLNMSVSTHLFAMINNDAWLLNSKFQGGTVADSAAAFLGFMQNIKINHDAINYLITTIEQIQAHDKQISKIIRSGAINTERVAAANNEQQKITYAKELEANREKGILSLANEFSEKITALSENTSLFIPGGFYQHAMLFEFKKQLNNEVVLVTYNTGSGLSYHENQVELEHGIFKKKYFPAIDYKFTLTTEQQNLTAYLAEILKTTICPNWQAVISDDTKVASLAKKTDAAHLYTKVLPLAAHLGGYPIDPKDVLPHSKYINGQRSGKCSEAVFHPLIKALLQTDELYHRFMAAYRKASITGFLLQQRSNADVAADIVQRQTKIALENLALKFYKHAQYFTEDETSAITNYIASVKEQLRTEQQPKLGLEFDNSAYYDSVQEIHLIKHRVKFQHVKKIDFTPKPIEPPDATARSVTPSFICVANNSFAELSAKLTGILAYLAKNSESITATKTCMHAIEKFLFSWPLGTQLNLDAANSAATFKQLQSLLETYHSALNKLNFSQGLLPQHIITILSGLAIARQIATQDTTESIDMLINKIQLHTILQRNNANPYLATGNILCDTRIQELTSYFAGIPHHNEVDLEKVYISILNKVPEELTRLLTVYDKIIIEHSSRGKNASYPRQELAGMQGLHFLSKEQKYLYVLCMCEHLNINKEEFREINNHYELLKANEILLTTNCAVLLQNKKETNNHIKLICINKGNQSYRWELETPISKLRNIANIKQFKPEINNKAIQKFLELDCGSNRAGIAKIHYTPTPHVNTATIQTTGYSAPKTKKTEEFYFRQYCHTRSSPSCELNATIDFFIHSLELVNEKTWQTCMELNLLQPGIIKAALIQNPDNINIIYSFFDKAINYNLQTGAPNAAAMFFIQHKIIIGKYLHDLLATAQTLEYLKTTCLDIETLLSIKSQPNYAKLQNLCGYAAGNLIPLTTNPDELDQYIRLYIKHLLQAQQASNLLAIDPIFYSLLTEQKCMLEQCLVNNHAVVSSAVAKFLGETFNFTTEQEYVLQWPDIYCRNNEKTIVVNLFDGTVFVDGNSYLPIPDYIARDANFIELFNNNVTHAVQIAGSNNAEATMLQLEYNNEAYLMQTSKMENKLQILYQRQLQVNPAIQPEWYTLVDLKDCEQIKNIISLTLLDYAHRIWTSTSLPAKIVVENKASGKFRCVIFTNNQEVKIESLDFVYPSEQKYLLWEQSKLNSAVAPATALLRELNIKQLLENFEDPQYIEVFKLYTQAENDSSQANYIISLPRYNLKFHVLHQTPLKIVLAEDYTTSLVLGKPGLKYCTIKNALILHNESGANSVLIPRKYFTYTPEFAENLEYTNLCLDLNRMITFAPDAEKSKLVFGNSAEYISASLSKDGSISTTDSADALYLAYAYLANFEAEEALRVLKDCEKQGGLHSTQPELENLMLLFEALPAPRTTKDQLHAQKIITTPEFIAVKSYAAYLYADSLHNGKQVTFTPPSEYSDQSLFYQDGMAFYANINDKINATMLQYHNLTNKIAIQLRLSNREELASLSVCNKYDPLIACQMWRLDLENIRHGMHAETDPHARQAMEQQTTDILGNQITDIEYEYKIEDTTLRIEKSEKSDLIINQIKIMLPGDLSNQQKVTQTKVGSNHTSSSSSRRGRGGHHRKTIFTDFGLEESSAPQPESEPETKFDGIFKDGRTLQKVITFNTNKDNLTAACKQLDASLSSEKFLGNLLQYYHLATCKDTDMHELKTKLHSYLAEKMQILCHGHDVFAKEIFISLYSILSQTNPWARYNEIKVFFWEQFKNNGWNQESLGYKFSADALYKYITTINNVTTCELKQVNGIQRKTKKELSYKDILTQQKSHLRKLNYLPTENIPLSYTQNDNILTRYKIHTLPEILTSNQLQNFSAAYNSAQQTAMAEIITLQKGYAATLEKEKFSAATKKYLEFEQQLGNKQNALAATKNTIAKQHLDDAAIQKLIPALKAEIGVCKKNITDLDNSINKYIEYDSKLLAEQVIYKIAVASKASSKFDTTTMIQLYLERDLETLCHTAQLDQSQATILYDLVTEYLFISIHSQQLEAALAAAKNEEIEKLATLLTTTNHVKPSDNSNALLVFQYDTKKLLREDQVAYLCKHTIRTDGEYQNAISQLIMGFGKTFLLPIVAKARADGNNLSIVEVPADLFATNFANLHAVSIQTMGQKTNKLLFNRDTPCSTQSLQELHQWLQTIQYNKDYLLTTGESILSINLRYIETLKTISTLQKNDASNAKLDNLTGQAYWLDKIVRLFRNKGDAMIDEVHAGLNIRKKLIYSIGTTRVDSLEIKAIADLYKYILPLQLPDSKSTYKDIMQNPAIVPKTDVDIWKKIMLSLTKELVYDEQSPIYHIVKEHQEFFQAYLHTGTCKLDEYNSILDHMAENDLAIINLYKTEITGLLPSTLAKQNKKHYGLLLADAEIMLQPCAVPYIASGCPKILSRDGNKVRTTTYSNQDETINYTIQAYISDGLPKAMVQYILQQLKQDAKQELLRGQHTKLGKTHAGKQFRQLIGHFFRQSTVTLDNYDKVPDLYAQLIHLCQHDNNWIFHALTNVILPTIKVEQTTLEHNACQHAYVYRSIQGISGTPDNHRSIARMKYDFEQYIGTNGITIDHIVRKDTKIYPVSDDLNTLVSELLSNNQNINHPMHAIIDAGGLFTGMSNLQVATQIAEFVSKNPNSSIKYILYFDAEDKLCATDLKNKIIKVGSSEEKNIAQVLNHCQKSDYFTFYDQRRTLGADIKQAVSSKAAVTFSYDTPLSDFLQAVMRMRDFSQTQQIAIFATKHVLAGCCANPDVAPPSVQEVLQFLYGVNQTTTLLEEHSRFLLDEMHNFLYQELYDSLLNHNFGDNHKDVISNKVKILDVVNKHSNLFVRHHEQSIAKRYGSIVDPNSEFSATVDSLKKSLINTRTQILRELEVINVPKSSQDFTAKIDLLIQQNIHNCKEITTASILNEQNLEVEAETEVALQTDLNLETNLQLEEQKQPPRMQATAHVAWLAKHLTQIKSNLDFAVQLKLYVSSIQDILQKDNLQHLPKIFSNNLFFSINQIKMYTEQQNTFDACKLPIQLCLMLQRENGMLQCIAITYNEAEELIASNWQLNNSDSSFGIWLESPNGSVYSGNKPDGIAAKLEYLALREEINLFSGNIDTLLNLDCYAWLTSNADAKLNFSSNKVLISREDQIYLFGKLANKIKQLNLLYEAIVVTKVFAYTPHQALIAYTNKHNESELHLLEATALKLYAGEELIKLQQQDPQACAVALIAKFGRYELTVTCMQKFLPQLDTDILGNLCDIYKAKILLKQIHTQFDSKQIQQAKETLKLLLTTITINPDLLSKILQAAVAENDLELIETVFRKDPTILNHTDFLQDNFALHPAYQALARKNYSILIALLDSSQEHSNWLEGLYKITLDEQNIYALELLVKHSIPSIEKNLLQATIRLLAANFKHAILDIICSKLSNPEIGKITSNYKKLSTILQKIENCDSGNYIRNPPYDLENVNFCINSNTSQLMLACCAGDFNNYKTLIAAGADLTRQNNNCYTPLVFAINGGNTEIIQNLLSQQNTNNQLINNLKIQSVKKIFFLLAHKTCEVDNDSAAQIVEHILNATIITEQNKEELFQTSKLLFEKATGHVPYKPDNLSYTEQSEIQQINTNVNIKLMNLLLNWQHTNKELMQTNIKNILINFLKDAKYRATYATIQGIACIVEHKPELLLETYATPGGEERLLLCEIMQALRTNEQLLNQVISKLKMLPTDWLKNAGKISMLKKLFAGDNINYESTLNNLLQLVKPNLEPTEYIEIIKTILNLNNANVYSPTKSLPLTRVAVGTMEQTHVDKLTEDPKILYSQLAVFLSLSSWNQADIPYMIMCDILRDLLISHPIEKSKLISILEYINEGNYSQQAPPTIDYLEKYASINDSNMQFLIDLLDTYKISNITTAKDNLFLWAVTNKHEKLVELLISNGVQVLAEQPGSTTPEKSILESVCEMKSPVVSQRILATIIKAIPSDITQEQAELLVSTALKSNATSVLAQLVKHLLEKEILSQKTWAETLVTFIKKFDHNAEMSLENHNQIIALLNSFCTVLENQSEHNPRKIFLENFADVITMPPLVFGHILNSFEGNVLTNKELFLKAIISSPKNSNSYINIAKLQEHFKSITPSEEYSPPLQCILSILNDNPSVTQENTAQYISMLQSLGIDSALGNPEVYPKILEAVIAKQRLYLLPLLFANNRLFTQHTELIASKIPELVNLYISYSAYTAKENLSWFQSMIDNCEPQVEPQIINKILSIITNHQNLINNNPGAYRIILPIYGRLLNSPVYKMLAKHFKIKSFAELAEHSDTAAVNFYQLISTSYKSYKPYEYPRYHGEPLKYATLETFSAQFDTIITPPANNTPLLFNNSATVTAPRRTSDNTGDDKAKSPRTTPSKK